MTDYELRIENDKVYSYYPLPQYGEGISKRELVMTKEVFIKCYEEWILKDNTSDDCVSRQSMLDAITEIDDNINMDIYTNEVREIIKDLPPVTPI